MTIAIKPAYSQTNQSFIEVKRFITCQPKTYQQIELDINLFNSTHWQLGIF